MVISFSCKLTKMEALQAFITFELKAPQSPLSEVTGNDKYLYYVSRFSGITTIFRCSLPKLQIHYVQDFEFSKLLESMDASWVILSCALLSLAAGYIFMA